MYGFGFIINYVCLPLCREQLDKLNKSEVAMLEKALCSADGIGSLKRAPSVDSFLEFIDQAAYTEEGCMPNRDKFTSFSSLDDDCSSTYSQPPSPSVCGSSPRSRSSLSDTGSTSDTEDETLLHQLFVLISEVADQLQSNHPHDFRSILKLVFEMYAGGQDMIQMATKSTGRANRFDEEFDTEEFLESK